MRPLRAAIVGAESTGKSWLTQSLAEVLRARNHSVHAVDEVLRHWCEREGRTPQQHEQMAIAQQQALAAQKIAEQATESWLLSDTTPLMTAVYSDLLFQDKSLYPMALAHQALYDITLVTGLDLPWVADGLQRDGPQVRIPVDRSAELQTTGLGAAFLAGLGTGVWSAESDLASARRSDRIFTPRGDGDEAHLRWRRAVERAKGWLDD